MTFGSGPSEHIPLFVAGYTGWATPDAARRNLEESTNIAGLLVIEHGIFVGSADFGGMLGTGPWALWGLIACLHYVANTLQAAAPDHFGLREMSKRDAGQQPAPQSSSTKNPTTANELPLFLKAPSSRF
jgi:hypothetical protein